MTNRVGNIDGITLYYSIKSYEYKRAIVLSKLHGRKTWWELCYMPSERLIGSGFLRLRKQRNFC
jgi:hypothetical protein